MAQFFFSIFSLLAEYVTIINHFRGKCAFLSRKINYHRWAIENLWRLDKRLTLCHWAIVPPKRNITVAYNF